MGMVPILYPRTLYFRDSDEGDEVDQVLVEEREHLQEDLQMREEFDEGHR
jgi:hypothetical protein